MSIRTSIIRIGMYFTYFIKYLHKNENIDYKFNNNELFTLANISKFTIDVGDTFIFRLWAEFKFIANNTVFLNFKFFAVQLLLYNPKFIEHF